MIPIDVSVQKVFKKKYLHEIYSKSSIECYYFSMF